ncbi:MAG: hypothetical protein WC718_14255 [Phycisphaerales bacterium]|jgi:hypothetical protein
MLTKTTETNRLLRRGSRALLLLGPALLLGACQTAVPRHASGVFAGNSGATASVVFSGPVVVASALPPGPELTRNDDRIALRAPETAYDQEAFAPPARANLYRPFYLYLRNTNSNEQIYFRPEHRSGTDYRTTYWGY